MAKTIVGMYSESPFRYRPVGATEYISVSAGSNVSVEVDIGTSIEISSTNDNSTIRVTGNMTEFKIIDSKLTDLSGLISKSDIDLVEIKSDSQITNVDKMISMSTIGSISIDADLSESANKNSMLHVSNVNNQEPLTDIDSYGFSKVNKIAPTGRIVNLEDANIVVGDTVDLTNTISLDNLSGSDIDALKDFDIPRGRGQDIVPGVYKRRDSGDLDNYTFEMDLSLEQKSNSMIRDNIINPELVFDKTKDDNYTFEMDLSLEQKSNSMIRDNIINPELVFDTQADLATYTFEMDIINPYQEVE